MILSDRDILEKIKIKEIVIKPFVPRHLQPAAYDIRLHNNFRVFRNDTVTHIDVKKAFEVTELVRVKKGEGFVIHPGEFILASTLEQIKLPNNLVGLLEGRSSLGRLGLIVHATAAFVGPGFEGFLTFEMSNISNLPIKLYPGMRVAQLAFIQMKSEALHAYGKTKLGSKYQKQEPPTASQIWKDFEK